MKKERYLKVLKNYNFTSDDARNLQAVYSLAWKEADAFIEGFYKFIFEFDHAKKFITTEEVLQRHKEKIKEWFLNLFNGTYDKEYFDNICHISDVHVNISLPPHYVNASFSYVRSFMKRVFIKHNELDALYSFGKLIDMNLDILTLSYHEGEQSKLLEEIVFIKRCIETNSITPYIQPIINSKNLEIEKYECLMRLVDEKGMAHSVFPYLETAKKTHLYLPMMKQMITKSFEFFSKSNADFSVNLTYEDISNKEFKEFIYEKISTCKRSGNIIFEIVETDFIEDFNIVKEFADKVRKQGCLIAIDDFGSGYSNMENIIALTPEIIKIDGSLIKNIDSSKASKTIVKNVVNMAKELDTKIVAEYVHSKEVLDIVTDLGVDFLQGFYLGEPRVF